MPLKNVAACIEFANLPIPNCGSANLRQRKTAIVTAVVLLLLSLVLLYFGAEWLVNGSSSLALRCGVSQLMVGLTIVAFGTSAPELVVSIKSALAGQGDLSVANVVGSNSFNIAVILGLTALICPIPVHSQVIKIDAPICLAVALLLPLLFWDRTLSRIDGWILIGLLMAYLVLSFVLGRKEAADVSEVTDSIDKPAHASPGLPTAGLPTAGLPTADLPTARVQSVLKDVGWILVSLMVLVFGARLLVDNAVLLARMWGISEAVVGLTIVAAGTSMPELATSLVAALKKEPDIAIGNIVGSNIFNILTILGITSLVTPINAPGVSAIDLAVMIGLTVLLLPMLYTGKLLHRVEGVVLLAIYAGYLYWLWPTAEVPV